MSKEVSQLIKHARRELDMAGLKGEQRKLVMDLVAVFNRQYQDKKASPGTVTIFSQLATFKPLSPLTDDPNEWMSVSKDFDRPMWQSERYPAAFSEDGGKTWWDASDPNTIHRSKPQEEVKNESKNATTSNEAKRGVQETESKKKATVSRDKPSKASSKKTQKTQLHGEGSNKKPAKKAKRKGSSE